MTKQTAVLNLGYNLEKYYFKKGIHGWYICASAVIQSVREMQTSQQYGL